MKHIVFEYKDSFTKGKWNQQECYALSVEQCKEFYGLGKDPDCEYRIIKVEESYA